MVTMVIRRAFVSLPLVIAITIGVQSCASVDPRGASATTVDPSVAYTIRYDPTEDPCAWFVTMVAGGLDPDGAYSVTLPDWGEWTAIADEHLRDLVAVPALTSTGDPTRWRIDPSPGWDGTLRLEYRIAARRVGTKAQRSHRTKPWCAPSYTFGFTANTIMRLDRFDGPARLSVEAPSGWSVYTSAAGIPHASDGSIVMLAPDSNEMIAIGMPIETVAFAPGSLVGTAQFGRGPAVAHELHRTLEDLLAMYSESAGVGLDDPVRLYILDGMSGGTASGSGLRVGFQPGQDVEAARQDGLRHLLAHEAFHFWLPGMIRSGSHVWFFEGFTEYLSLWHATASGLVSREYFIEQVRDYEARLSGSSIGTVAFADERVLWRDNDGPNEDMAYAGGAMLAMLIDSELMRVTGERLIVFVNEILQSDDREFTPNKLRAFLKRRGLDELYEAHISSPGLLPGSSELLQRAGFEPVDIAGTLAYTGLAVHRPDARESELIEERADRVTAVDPDGPGAEAGVRVGDLIIGYFPRRSGTIEIMPGVQTPYTYGLDIIGSGDGDAFLDVMRDGKELRLPIRIRAIPGGLIRSARSESNPLLNRYLDTDRFD